MIGLSALVLGALIGGAVWKNNAPSKYDNLAQCIDDKGGKIYVAYWCSACAQQKELLGSAMRKLEAVECSAPGSRTFDLCPDITATPTWELPNGEKVTGVRTPEQLAEMFECEI